jgi:hypothetical protein
MFDANFISGLSPELSIEQLTPLRIADEVIE